MTFQMNKITMRLYFKSFMSTYYDVESYSDLQLWENNYII